MSFEDLDGGSGNPLDDLEIDLDSLVAVAEMEPQTNAELGVIATADSIENDVCSDIPIGEKIVTRLEAAAVAMESGEIPGEVTVIRREQYMSQATNGSPSCGGKDVLYFDIETAPDWDRFDLFGIEKPDIADNETPDLMMPSAADTIAMTVDKLKELIARQNPTVEWMDHIAAEEAKGKARKGFLDAIKAGKEAKDKYGQFIKKLSVNPMFCRIVAYGSAIGQEIPAAMVCISRESERIALERFWCQAEAADLICGFNIRSFDLRVILVRSIIHGISPSIEIDLRKYGSSNVLDLMGVLYDWDLSRTIGLKQTCKLFGIEAITEGDGSMVNALVEDPTDENLSKLAAYCASDVKLVQRLHRERLAGYFCV